VTLQARGARRWQSVSAASPCAREVPTGEETSAMKRPFWNTLDRLLAELLPGWAKGRAIRRARRLARRQKTRPE